ncbi:MAG: hypothetical protein AAFN93_01990 [Bacteroidota bacterium]
MDNLSIDKEENNKLTRIKRNVRLLMTSAILLALLFHLSSCFSPCNLAYQGRVVDNDSGVPLDSVLIRYFDDGDFIGELLTPADGSFSVTGDTQSKFLGAECNELRLEFTLEEYDTIVVTTTSGEVGQTIRMLRP